MLAERDPAARCVADVGRRHVEDYKRWLVERPPPAAARCTGTPSSPVLRAAAVLPPAHRVGRRRRPGPGAGLPSDLPIADDPLPRFLDDAAATKLLQAARADPDPFVRLDRRVPGPHRPAQGRVPGDLTIDAVVQIGSAYWLHVPVGKLHTDRYIPLHPQLKELLDDWLAHRSEGCASQLTCSSSGDDRSPPPRVDAAVAKVARDGRASATSPRTGSVTPWPPRPSTGACRSRRSPPFSAIARCA